MTFEAARAVADAVLHEGYALYPYRASAVKNRMRWQFGVVAPQAWVAAGGCDPCAFRCECLAEAPPGATLEVHVRGLQLETRVEDGWDEGVERELDLPPLAIATLLEAPRTFPWRIAGARGAGRRRRTLRLAVTLAAEADGGRIRVRLVVENHGRWSGPPAARERAMRRSLVGAHALLGIRPGRFLSLADPPPDAAAAAARCVNEHVWPVLAGGAADDVVLASPIVLADRPAVAAESPADLYDLTEIDEILTLRIRSLTDDEKRAAAATDPRTRRVIERADALGAAELLRLHGARREPAGDAAGEPPEWRTLLDPPPADEVRAGARGFAIGDAVRLRPVRRADAMDAFLAGRVAHVAAIETDLEGRTHLGVTVDDDPAADLHAANGRYLYFSPDEVETLAAPGDEAAERID